MHLEDRADHRFHPDSYGYRPGRSAHEALAACRQRCWKHDWVIDLDVQKFFDEVPRDLVFRAVRAVTEARWVLLYEKRWLAPLEHPDGALEQRSKGTPQGSAVSPILANLFMHFAFDSWMARNFRGCPFERYADDAVVHRKTRRQAEHVLGRVAARMQEVGLQLHPDKTRIVYCKDDRRRGGARAHLVHLPRVRLPGTGGTHQGWPVVHRVLARDQPRGAQGQRRRAPQDADPQAHDLSLDDLAQWLNPIVAGWINYYGRFYGTALDPLLKRFNAYLRRWDGRKYTRRRTQKRYSQWLAGLLARQPGLFTHWRVVRAY